MKSHARKVIEKFDSGANTFSMRAVELCHDLDEYLYRSSNLTVKNKFRDFLLHEKLIRNDELFWTMFGFLYTATPENYQFPQEIRDAISRGTRLEITLSKRIRLSNTLSAIYNKMDVDERTKDLSMFITTHTAGDDITIYRGFLVPEGAEIRVGRFMDDPSSHIQDEGVGFSFTFDKKVALQHSIVNTSSVLLLHLYGEDSIAEREFKTWKEFSSEFEKIEGSKEKLERTLKFQMYIKSVRSGESLYDSETAQKYIGFGVRPCVAKYAIQKEDIITAFNYAGTEREIFCNPSNTILLHYEFTSWKYQMKQWKEKDLFPTMLKENITSFGKIEEKGIPLDAVLGKIWERHNEEEEYFEQLRNEI